MRGGRLRLSFVAVMPSPYMGDLFAALAGQPRVDLRVHYMEMEAPDTYWGRVPLPPYASVLPGRWFPFAGGRLHHNPDAVQRVLADAPDVVVVFGYAGFTSQVLMRALRRRGVPWIFFGERPGMRERGALGEGLRSLALRPAMRGASAVAACGRWAADAYRKLYRGPGPVESLPYATDLGPFLGVRRVPRDGGGVRFLYCGQIIERKGVDLLLEAFQEVAGENPSTLVLVGEGPLRPALERGIPQHLAGRVRFLGFRPVGQLPASFAEADVLVLPSRHDGWGVVVQQGLAAGLPVLASDAVGAAADLVEEGRTGGLFPSGDLEALAAGLRGFAVEPGLAEAMEGACREMALRWTPDRAAEAWVRLAQRVLGSSTS